MASSASEFNETDAFDEYNPHPYQGGYDIALTYGHPIPPSPSTCYPISTPDESDHLPPQPSSPLPLPLPLPLPSPPSPPPLSECRPPYDYTYPPQPYPLPVLDMFGFCPSLTTDDAEEFRYWNQFRKAGDYLFGCSEGYGERRIGIDSYGIPIYAYKSEANQPLTIQLDPAVEHKLDYYENQNWVSVGDEKAASSFSYGYDRHCREEPIYVEEELEMALPQRLTYHEVYEEQDYPKLEWHSSYAERGDECNAGNPQHAYERHYNEQPISVELEPYNPSWTRNLNYYEVNDGEVFQESIFHSSTYNTMVDESGIYENSIYASESHHYEQPLSVQLEPFQPSWSQNLSFHELDMEEGTNSFTENGTQLLGLF